MWYFYKQVVEFDLLTLLFRLKIKNLKITG